jgi:lipoprotein-anchoring transpeptidase ErfK/SrfK
MADFTPQARRLISPAAERRRREGRRKQFMRRRAIVLAVLLALLVAGYYGVDWLLGRLAGPDGAPAQPGASAPAALTFTPQQLLPAGDLNGDGVAEQVALGPVTGARRQAALVTQAKSGYQLLGQATTVGAFPLAVKDLPRARGVLVLAGQAPVTGDVTDVAIPGGQAAQAAGGEPHFEAWRLDAAKGLVAVNYYELAAPVTPPAATALVVDKWLNVLWFFENGQLASTHRVSTGSFLDGPAPSAANQDRNYITPVGTYTITRKDIDPPYWKDSIPGGDPQNPLGPRWLGFEVYPGDQAGVWGIHGTNEPELLGKWVSNGCIRVQNEELVQLFDRVPKGTTLEIRDSRPRS